jgi:hypothetical protein
MKRLAALSFIIACALGFTPSPFLPPLLKFNNGSSVTTAEQWMSDRRPEVSYLVQTIMTGTLPTVAPPLVSAKHINSTELSGGNSSFVELSFNTANTGDGKENIVSFTIEILQPRVVGAKKIPVFMTQWNHREWALVGFSRGYLSVVYPGADTRDAAPDFQKAYEGRATMALIIARTFVASRTLDYVLALPSIDKTAVSITGHSRNGKQSLLAAAFDTRITAAVGSSPGAPISSPYHFSSSNFYGEGPPYSVHSKWWLPSMVDYTAHPETLPIDGHAVMAMIAPRSAAIAHGWTDHEGDLVFADEMNHRAASEVFRLLGHPENIRTIARPGDHHGYDDVHSYFDWFDHTFNRLTPGFELGYTGQSAASTKEAEGKHYFRQNYLTPAGFNYSAYMTQIGSKVSADDAPSATAPLAQRVGWLLQTSIGTKSTGADPYVGSAFSMGSSYAEESTEFDYITKMMHRCTPLRPSPLLSPDFSTSLEGRGASSHSPCFLLSSLSPFALIGCLMRMTSQSSGFPYPSVTM